MVFNTEGQHARMSVKQICLIALVLDTTAVQLTSRYSRKQDILYNTTTAVVCIEVLKLFISLAVLWSEERGWNAAVATVLREIRQKPELLYKLAVPAFLYTVQNNILLVAAEHLDAGVFTILRQVKIPITAILWVVFMKSKLSWGKWAALGLLMVGVTLVQSGDFLTGSHPPTAPTALERSNTVLGVFCVLLSCLTSGVAAVYFEKIIKASDHKPNLWVLNIVLASISILFGLFACFFSQAQEITDHGFFFGYNWLVLLMIALHASDGLVVALVMKYADNIVKAFATALAICLTCSIAAYFGDFVLTAPFAFGAMGVATAAYWYSVA